MGKALYRKYRSRSLNEIVGQGHITALLERAIASGNVAHAYLLTGPRGVGKTSIARILAHEINSLPYQEESTHLDILEIDAASNNSVEDIRDLRDKVAIAPAIAKKKIYIIDEVHMLSKSAFNALLKTLEEPPEHVVFILATTDAEKLPATILSRVQRFNFRTIGVADAAAHLRTIAAAENIAISDAALKMIARYGKGSFRDSIGLLDQLRSLTDGEITPELIENLLGLADTETVQQLLTAYEQQDIASVTRLIDDAENRGMPAVALAEQLILTIRSQIPEKPHLLPLLDKLLDIARSPWPHVKLLVALAGNNTTVQPNNTEPSKRTATKTDTETPKPAAKQVARAVANSDASGSVPAAQDSAEQAVASVNSGNKSTSFSWQDFISDIKESSMGAYSYLAKSEYKLDGRTLTIYAGKAFNKKQLDKALPQLSAALAKAGVADGTVKILATTAPPSNSQTASVLDIMGGGEEITL